MFAHHDGNDGSMGALVRLVARWRAWRQRRVARRHSFMSLSDRTLADIGMRRADVYGAMVGALPLDRRAASLEGALPDHAKVHQLPCRRVLRVVSGDLSAAA